MTRVKNGRRPNELADKIAGFNDPSMGDERERDIILRAYTYGSVLSTYVILVLAIVFAVIGAGFWSVLLIAGGVVSGTAVSRYCKREGIDFAMANAQVDSRRYFIGQLISVLIMAGWLFAIAFHISTGHPLIDVGLGAHFESGESPSSVLLGGISGFLVTVVLGLFVRNSKRKKAQAQLFAEDED